MSKKFNPALMIIDLQEDFLPPNGSLAVDHGRDIIPKILELLDLSKYGWKAVIGTKDWHPEGHISFASTHNQKPYTTKTFRSPDKESEQERLETLWPDHCIQDSFGAAFPEEFAIVFNKMVQDQPVPTALVKKGYLKDREYYSCFMDVWKIHHTECEKFLKDHDITDVYVVGLAYDYCVLNSSIDAADLGFNTYVVKDLSKAVAPESNIDTEKSYQEHNIHLITSDSPELKKVEAQY
ncbi:hypothetical protein HII13_004008 [Brettanomyces bruxellensis]|uniref:nicotinamidase n=1 Tax=Dekkera bruxellensis TaxID=5007 RepID=A0A7D9GZG8_DEKBR|nr:hypothetical protein HII13_004008 [Brettanomyces bruxellensis]VUG16547.1 PNC1 [Brettanomyces bruxellensis]